jgi:hypothetical protein
VYDYESGVIASVHGQRERVKHSVKKDVKKGVKKGVRLSG